MPFILAVMLLYISKMFFIAKVLVPFTITYTISNIFTFALLQIALAWASGINERFKEEY